MYVYIMCIKDHRGQDSGRTRILSELGLKICIVSFGKFVLFFFNLNFKVWQKINSSMFWNFALRLAPFGSVMMSHLWSYFYCYKLVMPKFLEITFIAMNLSSVLILWHYMIVFLRNNMGMLLNFLGGLWVMTLQ